MTEAVAAPAQPGAKTETAAAIAGVRISEIDMLRGLVIVLMALDHVRDYFHAGSFAVNPLDPATTTPWLYITRWVTHFCAPTFVFLAGVSTLLQLARGKSKAEVSRLLVTRGLWLIVLEMTLISFGWSFGFPYVPFFQVIWAIGWGMIILAGLIWLPHMAVLAIGLAIVCGHNLLDPITPQDFGAYANLWTAVHEGGLWFLGEQPIVLNPYAIVPWAGVMALGYGMGALFTQAPEQRDRHLLMIGLGMIAAFFVLRAFGLYGDPSVENSGIGPFTQTADWRDQPTFGAQIMGFFDVQKYPPSLQFLLITLGPMLALFPLLSRLRGPVATMLTTFGAVPFFFYVLHVYLVHLLSIAANAAMGRNVEGMFNYLLNVFLNQEMFRELGFSLPYVYLAWFAVLAILYPLCRYWANLKRTRRDWWLSYL